MPRWKPDAQLRLQAAALALFAEKGYDGTTIAEIADRAGLEKRSFFRHFPDKREVLFSGAPVLEESLRRSFQMQAADVSAWDAVINALIGSGDVVAANREVSRLRRDIIGRNAELREREVLKTAQLEDLLLEFLVQRGLDARRARVHARLASLVYEQAFAAWLDAEPPLLFSDCVEGMRSELVGALPGRESAQEG